MAMTPLSPGGLCTPETQCAMRLHYRWFVCLLKLGPSLVGGKMTASPDLADGGGGMTNHTCEQGDPALGDKGLVKDGAWHLPDPERGQGPR